MTKSSSVAQTSDVLRFAKARSIAARFDLHPKTIARWGKDGLITPHKVNCRVVLFDVDEVTTFITKARMTSPGAMSRTTQAA